MPTAHTQLDLLQLYLVTASADNAHRTHIARSVAVVSRNSTDNSLSTHKARSVGELYLVTASTVNAPHTQR